MADLIGKSLGRYHILEQLGEGGMAVVYKALDTQLERNVAIKVITPSRNHSDKFIKRFQQEAKALAKLTHPNIVGVIDFGAQDSMPFLVMEYLPGGTLKQKLAGKPMHWDEAMRILIPIANALNEVHQHGIIHRDIKPSNILITGSGEPMLTDFGIAKILETEETMDLTGTGVGVGTPEYMSPEQAQGKTVDARADVYSLGVVLYEMVTGRKPYRADTPMAVIFKLASEPIPSPRKYKPDLSVVSEMILLKALAKDPKHRYKNTAELVIALEKGSGTLQQTRPLKLRSYVLGLLSIGLVAITSILVERYYLSPDDMVVAPSTPTIHTAIDIAPTFASVNYPTQILVIENTTIPSLTPTPTKVLAPLSSNPTPEFGENILLREDFSNLSFEGTINKSLWYLEGEKDPTWMHYKQENGILVGTLNPVNNLDFEFHSREKWDIESIKYAEWKIKIENAIRGDWASLQVGFEADTGVRLNCEAVVHFDIPEIKCFMWNRVNKPMVEIYIPKVNIQFNNWIIIRLEYTSDPLGFYLYIDKQMVRHISIEKDEWENRKIHLRHSLGATNTQDAFIGYIDDIIVTGSNNP